MVRITGVGEVKSAYELARKKYKNLPKFEDINNEFEIIRIDYPEMCLNEIRRLITHILQYFAGDMQAILSPHPQDPHSMMESAAFSKEEKQDIYLLYKKIWYWVHKGMIDSLSYEKESAAFISDFWKVWPSIKKDYTKMMNKVLKEWKKKPTKHKEDNAYLG
jgi:hypothetical protein